MFTVNLRELSESQTTHIERSPVNLGRSPLLVKSTVSIVVHADRGVAGVGGASPKPRTVRYQPRVQHVMFVIPEQDPFRCVSYDSSLRIAFFT